MPKLKPRVRVFTGKTYHVIARVGGGWNVKRQGAERATKSFKTQGQAVLFARKISSNQDAELVIHDENGRLFKKESFGKATNSMKVTGIS